MKVQIINVVHNNPAATYDEMQAKLEKNRTTIMRNIQQLKEIGILRRVGSKKAGLWEVIE